MLAEKAADSIWDKYVRYILKYINLYFGDMFFLCFRTVAC